MCRLPNESEVTGSQIVLHTHGVKTRGEAWGRNSGFTGEAASHSWLCMRPEAVLPGVLGATLRWSGMQAAAVLGLQPSAAAAGGSRSVGRCRGSADAASAASASAIGAVWISWASSLAVVAGAAEGPAPQARMP